MMSDKLPETGDPIIDELYRSVRLLLRHNMSASQGGGVPPDDLRKQMQKLDKTLGKDWDKASAHYRGYARRSPRKRL